MTTNEIIASVDMKKVQRYFKDTFVSGATVSKVTEESKLKVAIHVTQNSGVIGGCIVVMGSNKFKKLFS